MSKIEIDPSFAGKGAATRKRRRMRTIKRFAGGAVVLTIIAAFIIGVWALWPGSYDVAVSEADEDADLVQLEATSESGIVLAAAAAEAFLDIRGAPMIITLPEGPATGARRVVLSEQIDPQRARIGSRIVVVEDKLLDANQRVQLTLPSSSADLAAFQSRREAAIVSSAAPTPQSSEVSAGVRVTVDTSDGSWGEVLGGGGPTTVSYIETSIEDTTTEVISLRSEERAPLFRDSLIRLETERTLEEVLLEGGVDPGEARRALAFLTRMAQQRNMVDDAFTSLSANGLVALRMAPARRGAQILQMSIYGPSDYLVSIAQPGLGRFEPSADPWFEDNLLSRASRAVRARGLEGEVKLKDAIYSTALRNGLASELVGELMVMLSRVYDLDRIASEKDQLQLLLAEDRVGTAPAGRILFAQISGSDTAYRCYVVQPRQRGAPFGCFDPTAGGAGVAVGIGRGFRVPVSGTKISGFGPRHHQILDKTTYSNGIDWSAPVGTPVRASAAGRISHAAFSERYGNEIHIEHANGVQTRYAHLDRFAEGLGEGDDVEAGALIGTVGTTGRSTEPHLHFEMWVGGTAVDPLGVTMTSGASGAVEALVSQIIRVESAGDARAKNTRSTATGLGQFINSTWLRMMRTYRPDLVATLTEQELLELRFDPALSRTMVTNLARENEAFLRARGHAITPGRLYLAHFLGPQGADVALRADPAATVLETMGAAVVNANPFLKEKTVEWMTDWSDRKMSRVTRGTVKPVAPQPAPAEVKRYKEGIGRLLATL